MDDITITLDADERGELEMILGDRLSYYHETLAQENKSVVEALKAFDNAISVCILKKVAPRAYENLRKSVTEYLNDYLPHKERQGEPDSDADETEVGYHC